MNNLSEVLLSELHRKMFSQQRKSGLIVSNVKGNWHTAIFSPNNINSLPPQYLDIAIYGQTDASKQESCKLERPYAVRVHPRIRNLEVHPYRMRFLGCELHARRHVNKCAHVNYCNFFKGMENICWKIAIVVW